MLIILMVVKVSRVFVVVQLLSHGQSIGASVLVSVIPMNIQGWFPLGLTHLIFHSQESSPTPQFKTINSSVLNLLYGPTLTSIHGYWKNHSFDCMDTLSRFVIAFLPRSKVITNLYSVLKSSPTHT